MKRYLEAEPWKVLFIFVGLALILRIYFFVGFGLGDDPIYGYASYYLLNIGYPTLQLGPNYRYGVHLPIALGFKLLGVNQLSFVLFPLLTSLGQIVVLFFIGKELANTQVGLLASALSVLSPFDNVFSSTMTIDIPSTFLMCLSFYLFIKGTKAQGGFNRYGLYLLSIVLILWAYFIKYPNLVMLLPHGIYSLIEIKHWKKHVPFYGALVFALSGCLVLDYALTGNFVNYFQKGLEPTLLQPYSVVGSWYPRWMFSYTEGETLLFGFYYHIALILTLVYSKRLLKELPVAVLWLFCIFLFMQFMPVPGTHRGDYVVLPRFFRYAYGFLPPAILIMAYALFHLKEQSKILFGLLAATIIVSSLYYSNRTSQLYASTYEDRKIAAKELTELVPRPVYSDHWFFLTYDFFASYGRGAQIRQFINGKKFQESVVENKNDAEKKEILDSIKEGYVIVGGSRGVDVWNGSIFNLGDYPVPDYWRLIMEVPKQPDRYRKEPMRIYLVAAVPDSLGHTGSKALMKQPEREPARMLPTPPGENAGSLFQKGKVLFDSSNFAGARVNFSAAMKMPGDSTAIQDAYFFNAVSYWREANHRLTIQECQKLLERFPKGKWSAAAHYHIGLGYKDLGDTEQARAHFNYVLKNFSSDAYVTKLAKERLAELPNRTFWQWLKDLFV